jgi:hypothetical protein
MRLAAILVQLREDGDDISATPLISRSSRKSGTATSYTTLPARTAPPADVRS